MRRLSLVGVTGLLALVGAIALAASAEATPLFSSTTPGTSLIVVSTTGTHDVLDIGAGGSNSSFNPEVKVGGRGASIEAALVLTAGEILSIVVGGQLAGLGLIGAKRGRKQGVAASLYSDTQGRPKPARRTRRLILFPP